MGCWCGTCAITHLPINAGDKVRLFFMTQQDYGHEDQGAGFCYSHDVWYPRGLPVSGEYDDYGSIESFTEDINTKILVNGLKRDWVNYKAKNEWEKDVNAKDLTLAIIIEETERERAHVHDGQSPTESKRLHDSLDASMKGSKKKIDIDAPHPEDRKERPFGFIMVHEDVYQAMIKYDPIDAHHEDGGYLYKKRSEILAADMREFYHDGLEAARDLKDSDPIMKRLLKFSITKNHWNSFSHLSTNPDPPFCKGMSYYWDFLREKMEEGVPYDNAEVQTVVNGLIDFYKFSWAMSHARRAWMPQAGKGSQDNDTDIHKILANTTLKLARKHDSEMEEYNSDSKDWKAEHNKTELARRAKLKKEENAKKGKQVSTKKAR